MNSKNNITTFISLFLFLTILMNIGCFNSDDSEDNAQNTDPAKLVGLWKQIDDEGNDYLLNQHDVDFDNDGTYENTDVWNYFLFTSTTISVYRKIVNIYNNPLPDTTSMQIGNVYIEEDDKDMGPYTYTGTTLTLGNDHLYLAFDGVIMIFSEQQIKYLRFKKVDESEVDNEIIIPDDDD